MPPSLRWTARARIDLNSIYVTIGLNSPSAGERILAALTGRVRQLIDFPRLGSRRLHIDAQFLVLVEGHYLIFYKLHPDEPGLPVDRIDIVRIVDGRRDLHRVFH